MCETCVKRVPPFLDTLCTVLPNCIDIYVQVYVSRDHLWVKSSVVHCIVLYNMYIYMRI